jgi:hypothetical protein
MPRKGKITAPNAIPRDSRELIRPPASHADWMSCIIHLHGELSRLGLCERDLARYQTEAFQELEGGLDEQAMASMFDWWNYDTERLLERRPGAAGRPAKPRIELSMFITSKGNFAVEWWPVGTIFKRPGPDCDWKRWHRVDAYFAERPSNELIFIRSLRNVERAFSSAYETYAEMKKRVAQRPEFLRKRPLSELLTDLQRDRDEYGALRLTTDATLLQATEGLVRLLTWRLQFHFDVRLINDIYTEWQEIKETSAPLGTTRILTKWSIDNVAERTRRCESAELNTLAAATGCPAETFVSTLSATLAGSDPASAAQRLTKQLKMAGYKITPSVTRRYLELLQRHRPELFQTP